MIDGLEVVMQNPDYQKEELVYLQRTCRQHYESKAEVLERLEELLYYKKNRERLSQAHRNCCRYC
nr:hypothetical protein [Prochloraceae cyanobacterium]